LEVKHDPIFILTQPGAPEAEPFSEWRYHSDYFLEEWCFQAGENSANQTEPLVICTPREMPLRETLRIWQTET